MSKYRDFLKNTGGDPNAVVNDAYTHCSRGGVNITKVQQPDTSNVVVSIETASSVTGKLSGSVRQYLADHNWSASPLNAFLTGSVDNVQTYFNEKAHAQKMLPPWLERAISEHITHFYR